MEDDGTSGSLKPVKELAGEGQKHLEDTMDAAFHILSAMKDELCDPALWSTAAPAIPDNSTVNGILANGHSEGINGDVSSDPSHEMGGSVLDEARLHFKSSVGSLRAVLRAISDSQLVAIDSSPSQADEGEIMMLEEQSSKLNMEIAEKNKHVKHLIDQLRVLITDVTTWQSPCPVLR